MPEPREQEALLLEELHGAGFRLTSIWDWVNAPAPAIATEILLKYLELSTDERLIEGLARALTQKCFRDAEKPLLRKFTETENDHVRWALANALVFVGFGRSSWEEILRLASDPRYGSGRQNLVWRLHRVKLPEVEPALVSLLDDRDVDAFAVMALGYCGGPGVAARLRGIDMQGRSPLFRREVPKAIRRIEHKGRAA